MTVIARINGVLPGKYSTCIMQWNRGCFGDSSGCNEITFDTEAYTDLSQVGVQAPTAAWFKANVPSIPAPDLTRYGNIYIGGKDRATDPATWPYGVQYYLIRQLSTGNVAIIASPAISYGDACMPAGWAAVGQPDTVIRKHWFAHAYNASWDGIPHFGVDCHGAEVVLTDSEDAGIWAVAYGLQTYGAWQHINLASLLPDAGRIARLRAEVRYIDGSAGSAYLRSYGGQITGQCVGSVSPGSPFAKDRPTLQLDSGRGFDVKTTGNARLYLYLEAYRMTDPC